MNKMSQKQASELNIFLRSAPLVNIESRLEISQHSLDPTSSCQCPPSPQSDPCPARSSAPEAAHQRKQAHSPIYTRNNELICASAPRIQYWLSSCGEIVPGKLLAEIFIWSFAYIFSSCRCLSCIKLLSGLFLALLNLRYLH